MKKIWFILILSLISICTIIIFRAYKYYIPPQLHKPYKIYNHKNHDDTLRIAFIGDSWAYMHNHNNCLISEMIEELIQRPVSIQSFGFCGFTSKEIYEHIYDDPDLKSFLQSRRYDYCFISAGINDTYKKMSLSYYKKSIDGLIDFFLANHIHPIILEIPDYDIVKAYYNQKADKKLLRQLSMIVNSTSINCKQEFRNTLDELINKNGYKDKVSVIRYKSWNKDYENDLKRLYINDGMHLNEEGYEVLDSMIAETVSLHYALKHNLSYNMPK